MKLTSSPRNTILIVGALASLIVYQGNQEIYTIATRYATVAGGTPAVMPAQLDDLQQLYPLLATPQAAAASTDGQTVAPATAPPQTLDQLFGKTEKTVTKVSAKDKTPKVVDYFEALNQSSARNIRLDGLAPGVGAVINGAFIAVNAPIPSLEYPGDAQQKTMVTPRLAKVIPTGIVIREPNGTRTIIVTLKSARP